MRNTRHVPRPKLHDEVLQKALETEAERVIRASGFQSLSLRSLAATCQTSTTAVYSLFGSKESLIDSVVRAAFDRLQVTLEGVDTSAGPFPTLRTMLRDYRRWVLDNEHLYIAFFDAGSLPSKSVDNISQAVRPLMKAMDTAFEACILDDRFTDTHQVHFDIWRFFHGVVSMELRFRASNPLPHPVHMHFGEESFLRHTDELLGFMSVPVPRPY